MAFHESHHLQTIRHCNVVPCGIFWDLTFTIPKLSSCRPPIIYVQSRPTPGNRVQSAAEAAAGEDTTKTQQPIGTGSQRCASQGALGSSPTAGPHRAPRHLLR